MTPKIGILGHALKWKKKNEGIFNFPSDGWLEPPGLGPINFWSGLLKTRGCTLGIDRIDERLTLHQRIGIF